MTKIKTEIETLIARNVFLPQKEKDEILASDEEHQREVLPLLREMDKDQTAYFRKALKRNPNLFEDWGGKIIDHHQKSASA